MGRVAKTWYKMVKGKGDRKGFLSEIGWKMGKARWEQRNKDMHGNVEEEASEKRRRVWKELEEMKKAVTSGKCCNPILFIESIYFLINCEIILLSIYL